MESFGIAILAFIVISIIVAIIKSMGRGVERAAAHRNYNKAVERSTGIEKIRLMVRADCTTLSLQFKKKNDENTSWILVTTAIMMAHMHIADFYYGMLGETYESLGMNNAFDELSETISSERTKELIISSRLYGVAFGVVLAKAADLTNKKIKKTAVKKFIDNCKLDEIYRKELSKTTMAYIDFENDKLFGAHTEAAWTSHDIGVIACALIDGKLGKNNFADPVIATPMSAAVTYAYKETTVDSSTIKELEKEGLIG